MAIGVLNPALSTGKTNLLNSAGSLIENSGSSCDIFNTLGSLVDSDLANILKDAEGFFQSALGPVGALAVGINQAISGFTGLIDDITAKVQQAINLGLSAVLGPIEAAVNSIITGINNTMSTVLDAVTGAIDELTSAFNSIIQTLGNAVNVVAAAACTGFKNAVTGVPTGVSSLADTLNSSPTPAALKSAVTSASKPAADTMKATADSANTSLVDQLSSLPIFTKLSQDSINQQANDLNALIAAQTP